MRAVWCGAAVTVKVVITAGPWPGRKGRPIGPLTDALGHMNGNTMFVRVWTGQRLIVIRPKSDTHLNKASSPCAQQA